MEHAAEELGSMKWWTAASPAEVSARLDRCLRLAGRRMAGVVDDGHAELYVPHVRRVSKSAQLVLRIENSDGGTLILGRFTQHPHVFVISLVTLVVSAFCGLLALSYAVAQWSMGQSPSALWGVAICAAVGMIACWTSRPGLCGGSETTDELRQFVDEAVGETQHHGSR